MPSGFFEREQTPALLVLEDGRSFRGVSFGATGEAFGEEGRGFVRLSYAGDAGELREGVARLRAFAERVWNPITGHHTATYHPMEVLA